MRGVVVGIDKQGTTKVYRVVLFSYDNSSKEWKFRRQRVVEDQLVSGINHGKLSLENAGVRDGKLWGKTGDLSRFENGVNNPVVILTELVIEGQGVIGYKIVTYEGVVKNINVKNLLIYCEGINRGRGVPIQNGMYVKEQGRNKAHIRCYPDGEYIKEMLERKVSKHAKPAKLDKSARAIAKLEEMFNKDQIKELKLGKQNGVDIKVYANNKLEAGQMRIIREALEEGLNAELFADPGYSITAMRLLRADMKYGIDVRYYMNPDFSAEQLMELSVGYISGVDISKYADPKNPPEEMAEIRVRLENNLWRELDVESDDTWK